MLDKLVSPRECSAGEVYRWPTPRSRDWTNAFLESAGSNANIIAVVAVGSAVRPSVRSGDIDLVVICIGPIDIDETRPLEVDLRVYDAASIDARLESGQDMLGWAVKFGRVLFQRAGFWTKDCQWVAALIAAAAFQGCPSKSCRGVPPPRQCP